MAPKLLKYLAYTSLQQDAPFPKELQKISAKRGLFPPSGHSLKLSDLFGSSWCELAPPLVCPHGTPNRGIQYRDGACGRRYQLAIQGYKYCWLDSKITDAQRSSCIVWEFGKMMGSKDGRWKRWVLPDEKAVALWLERKKKARMLKASKLAARTFASNTFLPSPLPNKSKKQ